MRLVEMQAFKVICAASIAQPCLTHVASFLCLSNMCREPIESHDFSPVADSIYRNHKCITLFSITVTACKKDSNQIF